MTLIHNSDKKVWDAQVAIIQSQITDEIIDGAFAKFPKEVNDETIEDIKRKLKGRKKNLQKISDKYFAYLNNFQVIKGTNKDDWFDIERFENGDTKISVYRIKDGEKADIMLQRTYKYNLTKNIWLYGLDDDDVFTLNGNAGRKTINLKIVGGLNNDVYEINETKKVKVYDYKSKKSTFKTPNVNKKLTDDYSTNIYDYKKIRSFKNSLSPAIGYNPDDGIKLGVKNTFLVNSFERNPFTRKHVVSAFYYFATNGFELAYDGEFANSVNLEADELENRDFNRVKIEKVIGGTYLKWRGDLGAEFKVGAKYQNYNVDRTAGRFLETQYAAGNRIFERQQFINTEASYFYQHSDNPAFPTLGIQFLAKAGFTGNIKENRDFSYAESSLSITHKLIPSGKLVLASKINGQFIFDDEFEFYQASTIGGNNGMRAYRNERFTGKNAFYHSSDIRWNLRSVKTNLLPTNIGLFGGFDYGKVWGTPDSLTAFPNDTGQPRTSYGGGIFINAADILAGNIGVFTGDDGARITFTLGFDF